jgi:hypothetical protein
VPRRLPTKPKIHSFFDVIFMEDHACQLRAGDDRILIVRGRTVSEVFPHLLPHLDGTCTLSDLVQVEGAEGVEDAVARALKRRVTCRVLRVSVGMMLGWFVFFGFSFGSGIGCSSTFPRRSKLPSQKRSPPRPISG